MKTVLLKLLDIINSKKWLRIVLIILLLGFLSWIILGDQKCSYKNFSYESKGVKIK